EVAVAAMKEGLDDYVVKTPKHYARLPYALEACLDRRMAERARAQLSAVVESSDDAIIGMAPDGFVTSWNRGAALLLGYTSEEILGQSIEVLIPSELREAEGGTLARIARGEHVNHYETVRIAKDGRAI